MEWQGSNSLLLKDKRLSLDAWLVKAFSEIARDFYGLSPSFLMLRVQFASLLDVSLLSL